MYNILSPSILLSLSLLLLACNQKNKNHTLAELSLENVSMINRQYQLGSLIPQGGAIVNLWASWCLPCREELPQLTQLSHQLSTKQIAVILISVDEDRFLFEEFLKSYPQTLPTFRAVSMLTPEVLPTTYLVDNRGVVLEQINGYQSWNSKIMSEHVIDVLGSKKERLSQ